MIKYVPFLKAKQGELNAMSELDSKVRSLICPLFDFPRRDDGYTAGNFQTTAERIAKSLARHLGTDREYYFDNRDLDESISLNAKHNYQYILEQFSSTPVIPVIGIDRTGAHIEAVASLRQAGMLSGNTIACRFSQEDFDDFNVVQSEIATKLGRTVGLFKDVDLILDCRFCTALTPAHTAPILLAFSQKFCKEYSVRRVVVAGSSIPASAADLAELRSEREIQRTETKIYNVVRSSHGHAPVVFGDYTTVSPDYSDVALPPEILQNIMVAKLTYTFDESHYVIRGSKIKGNPRQYFGMAATLCRKPFFRAGYSTGDDFLAERSRGRGSNCTPCTVIKPSVVSHISYMARGAKI